MALDIGVRTSDFSFLVFDLETTLLWGCGHEVSDTALTTVLGTQWVETATGLSLLILKTPQWIGVGSELS